MFKKETLTTVKKYRESEETNRGRGPTLIIGAPGVSDLSGMNNLAELDTKENGNAAWEDHGPWVAGQGTVSPAFSETYLLPDGTEPLPRAPFFTMALDVVGCSLACSS
jgi:hypothetical protein